MTTHWYLMTPPAGHKLPKWKCTFGVTDDGIVLLPAAFAGNEDAIRLSAAHDGVFIASDSGHLYVDAAWMGREFEVTAEICAAAQKFARDNGFLKEPG